MKKLIATILTITMLTSVASVVTAFADVWTPTSSDDGYTKVLADYDMESLNGISGTQKMKFYYAHCSKGCLTIRVHTLCEEQEKQLRKFRDDIRCGVFALPAGFRKDTSAALQNSRKNQHHSEG